MEITIEQIKTGKNGYSKKGHPWQQMGLRSGETWYSYFKNDWNDHWKVGDVVDVVIEDNGKYKNIKKLNNTNTPQNSRPSETATPAGGNSTDLMVMISTMNHKLDSLIEEVKNLKIQAAQDSEDIPF